MAKKSPIIFGIGPLHSGLQLQFSLPNSRITTIWFLILPKIPIFQIIFCNPFKDMVNGTVQIEDQQYTIQPVFADRLTYVLQRNYDKARDPFVSYFGYESVTNCTDPTTINWSEKCSRMGFICSDEIDSFHKITLRIVLNLILASILK